MSTFLLRALANGSVFALDGHRYVITGRPVPDLIRSVRLCDGKLVNMAPYEEVRLLYRQNDIPGDPPGRLGPNLAGAMRNHYWRCVAARNRPLTSRGPYKTRGV